MTTAKLAYVAITATFLSSNPTLSFAQQARSKNRMNKLVTPR